jgi:hypothetical protein
VSRLLVAQRALTVPGWAKEFLWRRAQAVPSLDLHFADNKSLADAVTGQQMVTFTRASSATYIDSAGTLQTAATDVPRFDHNPTTDKSLGLLVEEQRTNLLLRSEEFDNASWTVNPGSKTVTANTTAAPNGTLTADTVTANGISAVHFVDQTVTLTAISYAYTVYAKAGTNNFIQLRTSATLGGRHANFDVSTGATGTSANITSSSIEFIGNDWYRCSMVFTSTAATGTIAIILVTSNSAASAEVNSLSTSVILWGAQLEAGAFPTSYIPTTTAAATRSADVASITGANFSSWYRQVEGTIYYDGTVSQGLAAFPWFYNITDGTINNSIGTYQHTSGIYGALSTGGTAITPDPSVIFTPVSGAAAKHALAVKTSDTRAAYNGTLSAAQTTTVMPVVNQLAIGQRVTGNRMTGTIRRLTYWPQRLSNSTLQAITQ